MEAATREVIDYFERLNQIPRCSKNEGQVAQWLHNWAEERGFAVDADPAGNMVIKVPASPGAENAPVVVIQGHMDMVCEKTADSDHDFARDPIRMVTDGKWLCAHETTLGADNGIAIAMALALVDSPDVRHPALELYFTVEEETGLTGVLQMDPTLVSGRIMVNLDSEDEGIFVVGCAGGRDSHLQRSLATEALGADHALLRICAGGMHGGHSGVDIGRQRANAIAVMGRLLAAGRQKVPMHLVSITGGTGRNVIPRQCEALVACSGEQVERLTSAIGQAADVVGKEHAVTDPDLEVICSREEMGPEAITAISEDHTTMVVNLLTALPTGPKEMSPEFPLLVQTSSNLALVDGSAKGLDVTVSIRSSVTSRLDAISAIITAVGRLAGATVTTNSGYPPWPVDADSQLLQRCQRLYEELFKATAKVQLMHAGLECAVIGDRCAGMDMISLGPTMENPHSPSERLYLPSVEKVWTLMVALLASYASEG